MHDYPSRERRRFKVDLGGLVDLLSNHLYSSPRVYLRELLQNAVDAITARTARGAAFEPRITIELERGDHPRLTIHDNGIGIAFDDVERFLSTIGRSSKHDQLAGAATGDFLGRFGIGMLSAFMVSPSLLLRSCQADGSGPVEWAAFTDGSYVTEHGVDGGTVGTSVQLVASVDGAQWFDPSFVEATIRDFGSLLPFPVELVVDGSRTTLTDDALPWECDTTEDLVASGARLLHEPVMDALPLQIPLVG